MVHFGEFLKPKACGQTELPDKSVLIGQKLVENAKIKKIRSFQIFVFLFTVFENQRKSLIQHCERSELRLHLEWPKVD